MSRSSLANGWALVLAGGDGRRLQGLTRALTGRPIPKQYWRITGGRSMLETTLARIEPLVRHERTMVIVNRDHLELARPQLIALPAGNILVQPANRDTGPGIVLSLLEMAERAADPLVALFPSDHHVTNERAFRACVARAAAIVAERPGRIALLGIPPDRAEPGYGYVELAGRLPGHSRRQAYLVAGFREKPASEVVRRLVGLGALWSSFVLVFRLDRMLELLRVLRPGEVARIDAMRRNTTALVADYPALVPWSFSSEVLPRIARELVVVRAENTGWSDWGTPEAIARSLVELRTPTASPRSRPRAERVVCGERVRRAGMAPS